MVYFILYLKDMPIKSVTLLTLVILYALIVHNFLYFPKAPDPIKEKSWK
jgi:hypothetical protein